MVWNQEEKTKGAGQERRIYLENEFSDFRINELMANLKPGHSNAISRKELALSMDMSDRAVRELIEKARGEGCLIMNKQDGMGYYLANDLEELINQYEQDTRRALSILFRRKTIRKKLKEAGVKV